MYDVPSTQRVTLWGLAVAVVGFALTRFTVTLAARETTIRFLLAGVGPLVIGLLLSAFGVALAVGAFETSFVRTVAIWCLVGTAAMVVLVLVTALGTSGGLATAGDLRDEVYLTNFVIGGSVGGTLTGIYAGTQHQRERDIREHSNRLVMVNRILRDEVINAMLAIEGQAELARDRGGEVNDRLLDVVEDKAAKIQRTIDDVKYLIRTSDRAGTYLEPVDLTEAVESAVETVRERHPDAEYSVDVADEVTVWADEMLARVVSNLLDNAVRYSESAVPAIGVTVTTVGDTARIEVSDDGPGLPADQRALLESGTIADHDDPTTGFGLNVVRLLTVSYGGRPKAEVTDEGTTVTVDLHRVVGDRPSLGADPRDARAYGVSLRNLGIVAGAALVAGLVMGAVMQTLAGTVPVIGSLYGVENAVVGFVTHEFHSVVFGMVYAALVATLPDEYVGDGWRRLGVATVWSLGLWVVAAGLVMPVWLTLVGVPASVPNLTLASLVGHLVWAATLAGCYEGGARWLGDSL